MFIYKNVGIRVLKIECTYKTILYFICQQKGRVQDIPSAPASATVLSPSPVRLWVEEGGELCQVKPSILLITTSPHPFPQLHPHLVVKVGQAQKIGPYSWPFCQIFSEKNLDELDDILINLKRKSGNICNYHAGGACRELCSLEFEQMNSIVAWCLDFLFHIECQQSSGLPSRWPDLLYRRAYMEKFGDLIVMWSFSGITATDRTFGVYRVNLTVWNTHTTKGWCLLRPSCCKDAAKMKNQ